jgi:hypothetical protein
MGIFNYLVQGFGWEVGREAAREVIDEVKEGGRDERQPQRSDAASERERAAIARERAVLAREKAELAVKRAQLERQERAKKAASRDADVEARLRALKKNLGK